MDKNVYYLCLSGICCVCVATRCRLTFRFHPLRELPENCTGHRGKRCHRPLRLFQIQHTLSGTKTVVVVGHNLKAHQVRVTCLQNAQLHCLIFQASLAATSDRHSLHRRGALSTIGTNRPVLLFKEYLEFEARVKRLEQREHSREEEVWGDTRKRLMG